MYSSTKTTTSSNKQATTKSAPISNTPPAQFFHENAYARVAAAKSKWTASDIVAEALRVPKNCAHVRNVLPPIHHYGVELSKLQSLLTEIEEMSTKTEVLTSKLGLRKQRSDTPIVLAAVFSIPHHPRDRSIPFCVAWRERTINWIRRHYGDDRIMCILEHIDEDHQHLHVLVHNFGASVKPRMAGHTAVQEAREAGIEKKDLGEAYRAGYVALQDAYWTAVSAPVGMARLSPNPRPRRSRKKHLSVVREELEEKSRAADLASEAASAAEAEWNRKLADIDQLRLMVAPDALLERERQLARRERTVAEAGHYLRERRAQQDAEHSQSMAEVHELLRLLSPADRDEVLKKVAWRSGPTR